MDGWMRQRAVESRGSGVLKTEISDCEGQGLPLKVLKDEERR